MKKGLVTILMFILTGCTGMNSEFGCNKTAGDACLSMTEANKLARDGGTIDDIEALKKKPGSVVPQQKTSEAESVHLGGVEVWVAPYTDNGGVFHRASVIEIK